MEAEGELLSSPEKEGELDVLGEREADDVPLMDTVLHAEAEPEGLELPLSD